MSGAATIAIAAAANANAAASQQTAPQAVAEHTPGPWAVLPEECDKPYIRVRGTRLGGRYKIANVLTPVYEGAPDREADETRANARLIAAAPDLAQRTAAVYWLVANS